MFNGDFWRVLLTLAAPFLVIAFLSALVYRVGLSSARGALFKRGVRS